MMQTSPSVIVMTGDQLTAFASEVAAAILKGMQGNARRDGEPSPAEVHDFSKGYVFGLAGISELFGVCKSTAQHYKNTFLAPAVSQYGRKIVTNIEKARELYEQAEANGAFSNSSAK